MRGGGRGVTAVGYGLCVQLVDVGNVVGANRRNSLRRACSRDSSVVVVRVRRALRATVGGGGGF